MKRYYAEDSGTVEIFDSRLGRDDFVSYGEGRRKLTSTQARRMMLKQVKLTNRDVRISELERHGSMDEIICMYGLSSD